MTTLTFHLARALGRGWGPGDEIVVTELDHHANVAPWQALRARARRNRPRRADRARRRASSTGRRSSGRCHARTRLLAIGAASNALGTVTDVARAVRLARDAGALCLRGRRALRAASSGGCARARLRLPGLLRLQVLRPTRRRAVRSGRAGSARLDVPKLEPAPETAPERLETGTLNHEGIAGAAAAVEFLASLALGRQSARAAAGGRYGAAPAGRHSWCNGSRRTRRSFPACGSSDRPPRRARTPTVAFTLGDTHPDAVADALAEEAVFVSTGDFYATSVVDGTGWRRGRPRPRRVRVLHHGGRGGSVAGGRRAFGAGPLRLS